MARDEAMVICDERRPVAVTIPPVRCFAHVETSKAQALKPLEESAEVFGAWRDYERTKSWSEDWDEFLAHNDATISLVDECCDVITATCNLLCALGVTDLTDAMAACERRNEERGRYEGVHTARTVDREALLALADELEEDACWEVQSPGVDNYAWMLKDVCDRIREACGEVA